jgi:HEAT repeat protein
VRLGPELRQAVLRAAAEIVGREGEGVAPGWLRDELRADEDELMERFAHTPDLESARLLGLAGTRRAAAALIGGLGDGAHDSAVIGLELLPRSIRAECLLGRLHQADAESATDRALLLGLLPPLSDRPGIESVAAFLNDAGVEVRAAAAEALGRSDETLVIALLEELRKDPMARLGVALAYGRMGSTRCTPLLALLSDPDASVRAAAAEGTGRCGLGSVAQLRDALRRETDPAAQRAMVRALGLEGGEEAVAELERMLASEDPPLRFEAVRALGHTDSEAAFPLLVAALSDADAGIRTAALSALGELGDARAKEPISRHIDDPDRDHRRVAAVAFDRVFGIESVAGFETALNDPDREVRLLAVTALGKLRLPDTASLLERVAEEDRDPLVRHTAAAVAAGLQGAGGEAP